MSSRIRTLRLLAMVAFAFEWSFARKVSIVPKDCHGNTCKLDVSQLGNVDNENILEIQLEKNGPTDYFQHEKTRHYRTNPEWYGKGLGTSSNRTLNLLREKKLGKHLVFASMIDENNVYQVRPQIKHGRHILTQMIKIPTSSFPSHDDPILLPNGTRADDERDLHRLRRELKESQKGRNLRGRRSLYDDSGDTLDILVVWTKAAECASANNGNRYCTPSAASKTIIEGLVQLAVDETNIAFDKSGIDTQLRLVHAYRHATYVENGGNAFNTALTDLSTVTNPMLADVRNKRTQYGADLVAMIIDDSTYCGLGWMGPSKEFMFSVSGQKCMTGYFSFGHEVAHNLGCGHDLGTTNACERRNSGTDFAYGWRDPSGVFRTIMSYPCTSGQCDNVYAGGSCTRIQMFSNTEQTYDGRPVGDSAADNARTINDNRQVVAAYYPVANECVTNSDCGACGACEGETLGIKVCVPTCAGGTQTGGTNPSPTASPTESPTPGPTKSPTDRPTAAPTTPQPILCQRDEVLMFLHLKTDDKPLEVSWSLVNDCTGLEEATSGAMDETNHDYFEQICVDASTMYTLVIEDTGGDGICCNHGNGKFKLEVNSTKVASGGDFNTYKRATFGQCPPTAPPSKRPSRSPTLRPTKRPTRRPTPEPSMSLSPSDGPTASPTPEPTLSMRPSSGPTSSPSFAPTTSAQPSMSLSPSAGPTLSPTPPPTASQQPSISLVPTVAPTKEPNCQDDQSWHFFSRSGEKYTCAWASFQISTYCRTLGVDGRSANEACRYSCNNCLQIGV